MIAVLYMLPKTVTRRIPTYICRKNDTTSLMDLISEVCIWVVYMYVVIDIIYWIMESISG